MKVGIISIGNELIDGLTVDTNSAWISDRISYYNALEIKIKITVRDSIENIVFNLDNLINEDFKYIFLTGGLGPTHDDITKKALAQYFKCNLMFNQIYYND